MHDKKHAFTVEAIRPRRNSSSIRAVRFIQRRRRSEKPDACAYCTGGESQSWRARLWQPLTHSGSLRLSGVSPLEWWGFEPEADRAGLCPVRRCGLWGGTLRVETPCRSSSPRPDRGASGDFRCPRRAQSRGESPGESGDLLGDQRQTRSHCQTGHRATPNRLAFNTTR